MARKTDAKAPVSSNTSAIDRQERPTDYLPAMFADEIEIIEDGTSDVVTPAAIKIAAIDGLRESDIWEATKRHNSDQEVDRLLSSELFRLAMALSSFAESRECTMKAVSRMTRAFISLDKVEKDFPEAAERINRITGEILSASYEVIKSNMLAEHARQNATMRPLARQKAAKSAAIERAKTIATELWQNDTAQEIRLLDMADRTYRALAAEGFAESLPSTVERLKEWIRPVAPDYASKGGRRRKTP